MGVCWIAICDSQWAINIMDSTRTHRAYMTLISYREYLDVCEVKDYE